MINYDVLTISMFFWTQAVSPMGQYGAAMSSVTNLAYSQSQISHFVSDTGQIFTDFGKKSPVLWRLAAVGAGISQKRFNARIQLIPGMTLNSQYNGSDQSGLVGLTFPF